MSDPVEDLYNNAPAVEDTPDTPWYQPGSKTHAAIMGAANGLSFGLANKGSALLQTIMPDSAWGHLVNPAGLTYDEAVARGTQGNNADFSAHPAISTAANVGGSLPGVLASGGYAMAGPAASTLAKIGAPLAYNAAIGGTEGAGQQSDTWGDFAKNTGVGATVGGLLGSIGHGLGKVGDYVGGKLGEIMPNANNVLRETGQQATDLFNRAKIQAIELSDNRIPGVKAKVIPNANTTMEEMNANIKSLPKVQQQVISENHRSVLDGNPLTQGATNPNEIQRKLITDNSNKPVYENTPLRSVVSTGVGAGVGYGVDKGLNYFGVPTGGMIPEVVGALIGGGMGRNGIAHGATDWISKNVANREAEMALMNRASTAAPFGNMAGRVNMGITRSARYPELGGLFTSQAAPAATSFMGRMNQDPVEAYYNNQ